VKASLIIFLTLVLLIFCSGLILADFASEEELRQKVINVLRSAGLEKELNVPVKVSSEEWGVINIADEGNFIMQYMVEGPETSAKATIVIDPDVKISSKCRQAVVVTHGWVDKAASDWPNDIAREIRKHTDPNLWLCATFDWQKGAAVVTPIDAGKYAQQIAGPRLASALLEMNIDLEHIHLIGHSAGCWAINTAAGIIAEKTNASIHVTFLDAYVPPLWKESELGDINSEGALWVEHYYTKDITLDRTHIVLPNAHNADLSDIDPGVNEHEFPYRWYYATITGKYGLHGREKKEKVIVTLGDTEYGFVRSKEAGESNWLNSLKLDRCKKDVKDTKKKSFWDIIKFWK